MRKSATVRHGSVMAAAVLAFGAASSARATEGGGNTYPNGVNTVLSALLPPPGETRYYDYAQHYSADRFDDGDGRSKVPNFGVTANVNAFRVIHSWNASVGPFQLVSIVIVPLLDLRLQAGPRKREITGIGDVSLQPAFFGWSNMRKNLWLSFGPGVYVPSGRYRSDRLANTGRNTTVFFTQANLTWFIDKRLELSIGNAFELHSRNPATRYRSGSDIDTDFEITGQPLREHPGFHIGLNGYAYEQFEDDRIAGAIVPGGNRGRAIALGPTFKLDLHRSGVVFKYDREFDVRNRPQGNRFWFQFTIPLSSARAAASPSSPPVVK